MAPVGSYESLQAAIRAGADAVYFGVEGLNMRSRSSANFTLDDLRHIASLCSRAGVKTYLTVNTIIYDDDIALLHDLIDGVEEAIRGTEVTFSAFVIEAVRVALENLAEEE